MQRSEEERQQADYIEYTMSQRLPDTNGVDRVFSSLSHRINRRDYMGFSCRSAP